ncbi:hypothetical protein vseg_004844 [Gypsophila vaccaria]
MEIEIKVMWCKGLTSFNFFQKLTIYALVSIKPEKNTLNLTQEHKQEQKTPVDEEGDGDPEWNHTVTFDLRRLEAVSPGFEDLSVGFEFRHRGQLFGDKTVGEVNVPLKSLVQSVGSNVVRFVSYEVRSPEVISIHGYHNSQRLDWDYHQQHYQLDQHSSSSDVGRIQYPRIELDDWSGSSSTAFHLPPPQPVVYPPSSQCQWCPPPHQSSHYPPPPPPPPVVYPPPPYGDPHWGYYRPPGYNNQPNW